MRAVNRQRFGRERRSAHRRRVHQAALGPQRVAAARALIGAPPLVIADEPTSALDTDQREAFLKLLFDEVDRSSASILFVSHDHTLKPLFHRTLELRDVNRAAAP